MLSATNSVTDVKALLGQTYDFYGFANEAAYTAAVTNALTKTELLQMIPAIGEGYYDSIADKDKVDLTLDETYIYNAETHYAAGEFLDTQNDIDEQSGVSAGSSLSVEGYSRSSSDIALTGYEKIAWAFCQDGTEFLSLAGYNVLQLQRGGGFFAP